MDKKKSQNKHVVIGLSGGVDSSVAAYLLKEQGFQVSGMFMINWHETTGTLSGDCPWEDDRIFAELVARKLDIPFHIIDLSASYSSRVVDYMFDEYSKGRTPNPDVLCNREIKFDIFAKAAFEIGADYVATGHYCRKSEFEKEGKTIYQLLAGVDNNKDQSYFLCQLSQQQLSTALFPIGHLTKPKVREIASKMGLATAERKDSQGICFVGKVDLPTFLQQKLEKKQGKIIEIPATSSIYFNNQSFKSLSEQVIEQSKPINYQKVSGFYLGLHDGAHFYTIGQRKGLNIGGKEKPLYVIAIDVENNVVYTGQGDNHPGLNKQALKISSNEIHWIRTDCKIKDGESVKYLVRIRYRQPLQKATLFNINEDLFILFDQPQRGITSGQFAAWYNEEELIGSGVIS